MNTRKRIHVGDLRADSHAGKSLVNAYLHDLEIAAIESLINDLEEVRKPTPRRVLNSEQKELVATALEGLRSRLKFHRKRRYTSLQLLAHHNRRANAAADERLSC